MSRDGEKNKTHAAGEAFSISRRANNIEFNSDFKSLYKGLYPSHTLHTAGRIAITLVARSEVIDLLSSSPEVRRLPYNQIIKEVLGISATDCVLLPRNSIQFTSANEFNNRKIVAPIEDPEGILLKERDQYLARLANLCSIDLPYFAFSSEITIGKTKNGAEPLLNALEFLEPFVPKIVELEAAKPFPPN